MGKYEPGPSPDSFPQGRKREAIDPKKEEIRKENYFDWVLHRASAELAEEAGGDKNTITSELRGILDQNELYEELFTEGVAREKSAEFLKKAYEKKFLEKAA